MGTPARYDPAMFKSVFESSFTYISGFRRNVHRFSSRPAIHSPDTGQSLSYAELGARVDKVAAGLARLGAESGDVVTYQLTNRVEFALLYLATQQSGMIGSPINFRLSPGETAYILDDSQPRIYVYDASYAGTAAAALELCSHRPEVVMAVGEPDEVTVLPGALDFESLLDTAGPDPMTPTRAPTAGGPAGAWAGSWAGSIYEETTRLYTSGTTGLPKGVPLNSLVEVLSAHDVIMHFPLSPTDRTLNMTPWFHRGGLYSGGPNPCFYVGASVLPMARFDADLCLDYVEQYGLTYLIGAPTTLSMLADTQEARPRDLSSLRGIVTMGSPLEREACLRYQRVLTEAIFNGYGTSEAFWNTFLRPEDLPQRAGTAGRACTDDDVAVVRIDAGGPSPGGPSPGGASPGVLAAKDGAEVGEVIVRSPKCAYSYLNQPDEQASTFRDGWVYIGDLATWDEDEYITIVGRKDDMIISGGENVHPVQVEEALNEHPKVVDSAVVGFADNRWGEVVVAYVVAGGEVAATELDEHCRHHQMLASYKRPRAYRFVEGLPLTATGKKMRYQVRRQAVEESSLLIWI